jgi:putative ABC transport system permease protein
MLSDFKFGLRALLSAPGFAFAAVLILALGIGANTAVFSVVDAALLRPLPYSHPENLYAIGSSAQSQFGFFNIPEFCDYRDRNRSFQGLAAVGTFNTSLVDQGEAQFVQGLRVSAGLFPMLGARPEAGRLLVPDDDRAGAPRVAVIGYGLWQRLYGGRSDAVGRIVSLSGQPHTIVGVLPPGFLLPVNGNNGDVCVPLQAESDPMRHQRTSLHFLFVFGRIAPGLSPAQATGDLRGVLRDLRRTFPEQYVGSGENQVTPLIDKIVGDVRPLLLTLLGVVATLLLLASANLAGLLLVRTMGRQREIAIRAALGSSRLALVRLLLAECSLLAGAGGLAGLWLAHWGLRALLTFIPAGLPRVHEVHFDGAIFAFAAAVALAAGLAPALVPIWFFSRADLRNAISAGGRSSTGGPGQKRLRHVLATFQVALALALIVCAGLFLRSFWVAGAERLGFQPEHALAVRLSLPEAGYPDRAALIRFDRQLQGRLAAIPGVTTVGATSLLPLTTGLSTAEFRVVGRPPPRTADVPSANYRVITPNFFDAMGIRLLRGRSVDERDDDNHPLAVVVNATLADAFFPDHRVLGQRLWVDDTATGGRTLEIVGVVANVKQGKMEDPPSYDLYVGYGQMTSVAAPWIRYRTFWVLRSAGQPQAIEGAVRREIRALDPGVPVASVHTLDQVIESARAVRRFSLIVIGFFAATALLLTVAGIYAVLAYGVVQRTREIGVRLALGATRRQVLSLIFQEGLGLVATGTGLGLATALSLSPLIAAQLYRVPPDDPTTLIGAVLLLFAIGFFACWVPARRAAQTDPLVALHAD